MSNPMHFLATNVAKLQDVGPSVVSQARKFDQRQARIDELQDELDAERADFVAGLKEDWTEAELRVLFAPTDYKA